MPELPEQADRSSNTEGAPAAQPSCAAGQAQTPPSTALHHLQRLSNILRSGLWPGCGLPVKATAGAAGSAGARAAVDAATAVDAQPLLGAAIFNLRRWRDAVKDAHAAFLNDTGAEPVSGDEDSGGPAAGSGGGDPAWGDSGGGAAGRQRRGRGVGLLFSLIRDGRDRLRPQDTAPESVAELAAALEPTTIQARADSLHEDAVRDNVELRLGYGAMLQGKVGSGAHACSLRTILGQVAKACALCTAAVACIKVLLDLCFTDSQDQGDAERDADVRSLVKVCEGLFVMWAELCHAMMQVLQGAVDVQAALHCSFSLGLTHESQPSVNSIKSLASLLIQLGVVQLDLIRAAQSRPGPCASSPGSRAGAHEAAGAAPTPPASPRAPAGLEHFLQANRMRMNCANAVDYGLFSEERSASAEKGREDKVRGARCPVSGKIFRFEGPQQPVALPCCGAAISVEGLRHLASTGQLSEVKHAGDCSRSTPLPENLAQYAVHEWEFEVACCADSVELQAFEEHTPADGAAAPQHKHEGESEFTQRENEQATGGGHPRSRPTAVQAIPLGRDMFWESPKIAAFVKRLPPPGNPVAKQKGLHWEQYLQLHDLDGFMTAIYEAGIDTALAGLLSDATADALAQAMAGLAAGEPVTAGAILDYLVSKGAAAGAIGASGPSSVRPAVQEEPANAISAYEMIIDIHTGLMDLQQVQRGKVTGFFPGAAPDFCCLTMHGCTWPTPPQAILTGGRTVVFCVRRGPEPSDLVALKVFYQASDFFQQLRAHAHPELRHSLPRVYDFGDGVNELAPDELPLVQHRESNPATALLKRPFLVMERGEDLALRCTRALPELPARALGSESGNASRLSQATYTGWGSSDERLQWLDAVRTVLKGVALRIMHLHDRGYVHCDITPNELLFFKAEGCWRFSTCSVACQAGAMTQPGLSSCAYAPPEAVQAHYDGEAAVADVRQDSWSLGVVACSLLCTGIPGSMLPQEGHQAVSMLLGISGSALPWEVGERHALLRQSAVGRAALGLVARDPATRWTVHQFHDYLRKNAEARVQTDLGPCPQAELNDRAMPASGGATGLGGCSRNWPSVAHACGDEVSRGSAPAPNTPARSADADSYTLVVAGPPAGSAPPSPQRARSEGGDPSSLAQETRVSGAASTAPEAPHAANRAAPRKNTLKSLFCTLTACVRQPPDDHSSPMPSIKEGATESLVGPLRAHQSPMREAELRGMPAMQAPTALVASRSEPAAVLGSGSTDMASLYAQPYNAPSPLVPTLHVSSRSQSKESSVHLDSHGPGVAWSTHSAGVAWGSQGASMISGRSASSLVGSSRSHLDEIPITLPSFNETPFCNPSDMMNLFPGGTLPGGLATSSASLDADGLVLPAPPYGGFGGLSWQSEGQQSLHLIDGSAGTGVSVARQGPNPWSGLPFPVAACGQDAPRAQPDLKWISYSRDRLQDVLLHMEATRQPVCHDYMLQTVRTETRSGCHSWVQFARHRHTNDEVAIKFYMDTADFDRERRALASLGTTAAATVAVLDSLPCPAAATRYPGFCFPPCLVMEKGQTLSEWAAVESHRSTGSMIMALNHVISEVQALHSRGYVHRDIKPSNILCRPRKHDWTLIDFGCAVEAGTTASLNFLPSPKYSAPEALRAFYTSKDTISILVDPAQDIWALGIVMFEMLTGELAFQTQGLPSRTADRAVKQAMLGDAPLSWEALTETARQRLNAAPGLCAAVLGCLKREARLRPTAAQLLAEWASIVNAYRQVPELSIASQNTRSTGWTGDSRTLGSRLTTISAAAFMP